MPLRRDLLPFVRLRPAVSLLLTILCVMSAGVDRPLAAHVEITPIAGYSDSGKLPKPDKILVYDFEFDPSIV
jgi:hypothetical protein